MEESGAVVPTSFDSRPSPNDINPSKGREEREVTSCDEDALPVCSSAPSMSNSDPAFVSKSSANLDGNSSLQGVKPGKSISANQSGSADTQPRTSLQIGTLEGYAKQKGSFKSSSPQWHKPNGGNSNLVISFSDDDSGSDNEQQEPRKECELDSNSHTLDVVTKSKQPSPFPPAKATTIKTKIIEGKTLPKKLTMNKPRAPSMLRSNIPKPRNIWPSVEQRSHAPNSNIVSRNSTIRSSGRSKSVDLSDSKLQDLRQQIALRENELKLKAMQQNKENLSDPCSSFNNLNQSNPAPRRSRDLSSDVHLDVKESEAKRKKLSQDGSNQRSEGFHEKVSAKHLLPSNELVVESNNFQGASLVDREHHDGQIAQRESMLHGSTRMQIPNQQFSPLSANPTATGQDGQGFSVSCSLLDGMPKSSSNLLVSNPKPSVADISLLNLPKNASVERAKQSSTVNGKGPSSSKKQATNDQQDVQGKANRFEYDGNVQGQAIAAIQTSPHLASTSNHRNRVNNQGFGDTDIQSLFATEDLYEKQLEQAQELRHRCEIEERNALKAYLKAQRALIEANAQCSYLYRKRELFSAQLCSLLTDNPNLMLPLQQQGHFGDLWNFSHDVSEVNLDILPSGSDQIHAELDADNHLGYESNVRSADDDLQQRFSPNVDGNNLGSEACSEPDVSTSELLPSKNKEALKGVLSPLNDPNVSSAEGEEMYAIQSKNDNIGVPNALPDDNSQESERLEAYLRSKLFSRLETLTSLRRNGFGGKKDEEVEQPPDADIRNGAQMTLCSIPSSQPEKEQVFEYGSASGHKQEVSAEGCIKDDEGSAEAQLKMPIGLHSDITEKQNPDLGGFGASERNLSTFEEGKEKSLYNSADRNHRVVNSEYSGRWPTDANQCLSMSSMFRSAFYQVKGELSASFDDVCIFTQNDSTCYSFDNRRVDSTEDSVKDSLVGVIDSYSCNSLIDPLWPLCMHELRGRCNNEECPWQHVKEHTRSNLQHKSPDSVDSVTGSSSNCSNQNVGEHSHVLTPPSYLVCMDSLKADSRTHRYILDRQRGSSWQKIFSYSVVVPSQRHGFTDTRAKSNRQPLHFQTRYDTMNLIWADLPENNQVLETALLILNQEIDKAVVTRKSLALLSRGLEADPTSLDLWVVYLLIYYSDRDSDGDDELFSCAVKNNEGSYELWLMYIKSRRQLQGQLSAYDRALSSLCRYAHNFNGDTMHASACILDLFLQKLHCFCMSGNVEIIVQRIHRLADDVKDPDCLLLFDILQCLEVSDKCVFWVSCAYLLVYKKLPDVIVGMFEFDKDISLIDWPSVYKTKEQKQAVHKLMERAAGSMQSHVDSVHPENSTALRAAQLFALNHVKLAAAVDNFEICNDVLEKYSNQYSSCLEVALLAARVHSQKCEGNNFLGFEKALGSWPKEVPGIQCIWNQFAEYALQNGGYHVGKEIMLRWSKAQSLQNSRMDHLELFSWDDASKLGSMDAVYGLLNLSLYELLHKNLEKAYLAVDKAMRSHRDSRHCIKEHAVFMMKYGSQIGKDVSLTGLLNILKSYKNSSPVPEPLTQKFIQQMPKPRLRHLVRGLISPISPDFSTVNLVLESWFGSSLFPQNYNKVKDLVDFVEAILDFSPYNYPLAISTCKLLLTKDNDSSVSTSFWASSLLVNTVYESVPVPPEIVWVEAARLLAQLTGIEATVIESFHQRALSVYPFSINLWKSYLAQSASGDSRRIVEAATEKGIELPLILLDEKGLEATKEREAHN